MITKEPIDTESLPDTGSFKSGGGGLGLIGLTGLEDRNSCCDQLDYSVRSSSTRDPGTTDHDESPHHESYSNMTTRSMFF